MAGQGRLPEGCRAAGSAVCQAYQVRLRLFLNICNAALTTEFSFFWLLTISENQGLEEELLQLENERIDVKSAYEKAALNAHSSRHSLLAKHSYYRQNSGQDEEISATRTKGQRPFHPLGINVYYDNGG